MKLAFWSALRPGAEDWRNVLAEYDAVVYEVGRGPVVSPLRQALAEWPGMLVLDGDDLGELLGDDPEWRARVLDRAIAVVVRSRELERRLRAEHPWAEIVYLEPGSDPATAVLDRNRRQGARWLEALLEAAAAEVPGFFPGDRSSPWRRELEELLDVFGAKAFQAD